MPFHEHMPAAPEEPRGEVLRASPAWALLVLVAGLLLTAGVARSEWLEARANAEAVERSLADAAQAHSTAAPACTDGNVTMPDATPSESLNVGSLRTALKLSENS